MGRDWNEPRDKGPPIEEWERHRKKGGGRKRFVLQTRYIGPKKNWLTQYWERKRAWHTYSRYKTKKARDEALRALQHKAANSHTVYSWYEYRIQPDD